MQVKVLQNALREHSAMLSTFIKLPFVLKTIFLYIFEWPLKTGFTVVFHQFHFQATTARMELILPHSLYVLQDSTVPWAVWHQVTAPRGLSVAHQLSPVLFHPFHFQATTARMELILPHSLCVLQDRTVPWAVWHLVTVPLGHSVAHQHWQTRVNVLIVPQAITVPIQVGLNYI